MTDLYGFTYIRTFFPSNQNRKQLNTYLINKTVTCLKAEITYDIDDEKNGMQENSQKNIN